MIDEIPPEPPPIPNEPIDNIQATIQDVLDPIHHLMSHSAIPKLGDLYLWERSEKCDIIETVCQQFDPESSFDSSTGQNTSLLSSKQRKKQNKRKNKGGMEDVDRYEIMQMKTDISIKQNTLLYTDQDKEEAEAKLFGVIEKMRDQNNPIMFYLKKRKDSLENVLKCLKRGLENSKRRKRKSMSMYNIESVGRFQKLPFFCRVTYHFSHARFKKCKRKGGSLLGYDSTRLPLFLFCEYFVHPPDRSS